MKETVVREIRTHQCFALSLIGSAIRIISCGNLEDGSQVLWSQVKFIAEDPESPHIRRKVEGYDWSFCESEDEPEDNPLENVRVISLTGHCRLLPAVPTRSQIVSMSVDARIRLWREAPGAPWQIHYAALMHNNLGNRVVDLVLFSEFADKEMQAQLLKAKFPLFNNTHYPTYFPCLTDSGRTKRLKGFSDFLLTSAE